jgi:hypothetical protein
VLRTLWSRAVAVAVPVFPLLGVAQWVLLTPASRPLRLVERLVACGYAVFYSGLDALAGVAAGTVEEVSGGTSPLVGRWWLVFQQQTPLSNSMGCAG